MKKSYLRASIRKFSMVWTAVAGLLLTGLTVHGATVNRYVDWRLRGSSPCVDAGTNRVWMTTDLDNNPRIRYGVVDMGAFEYLRLGSVLQVR